MKVLKGKTMLKFLTKKGKSRNSSNNKKKKNSKPMIRKIEDGEDLTTTFKPPTIDDIKGLEKVRSEVDHPMDEMPKTRKVVNKSQVLLKVGEEPEAEKEEQVKTIEEVLDRLEEPKEEEALWKLKEPEIGKEIPDQDDPSFLENVSCEDSCGSEEESHAYKNDTSFEIRTRLYVKNAKPMAVIGNVMLVFAEKEHTVSTSPISTAPTEPATPEEALSRSFITDRDDDERFISKTTTYSIPEEGDDTKSLWQSMEKNVQLSQNLLRDFNCEARVEQTIDGMECIAQKKGAVVIYAQPKEEKNTAFAETMIKQSRTLLDDATEDPLSMAEDYELEKTVFTHPSDNAAEFSFDAELPFDQQQQELSQLEMAHQQVTRSYAPPTIVDEEEFPDDEVDQEANDFLDEIDNQEIPSVFYSTTASVAKSVKTAADSLTTDSVVAVAAKSVASAVNTVDQAGAAPSLDTIIESASAVLTPTVLEGFFDNPKPRRLITSMHESIESLSDVGSEEEFVEIDSLSSVSSRPGFDNIVDGCFSSETFTAVTDNIPDLVKQWVVDDARSQTVEVQ